MTPCPHCCINVNHNISIYILSASHHHNDDIINSLHTFLIISVNVTLKFWIKWKFETNQQNTFLFYTQKFFWHFYNKKKFLLHFLCFGNHMCNYIDMECCFRVQNTFFVHIAQKFITIKRVVSFNWKSGCNGSWF